MDQHTEYSVEILLPEEIDRRLRRWAEKVPGATWPAWGGHVTLLNRFIPLQGLDVICDRIERVTRRFAPFEIDLQRIVCDRHVLRPQLMTVLVAIDPDSESNWPTLVRLENALWSAVAPLVKDATPELRRRPFLPHLTLTRGTGRAAAQRLAQAAREAKLEVQFQVDTLWLVRFEIEQEGATPDVQKVRSFHLGGQE